MTAMFTPSQLRAARALLDWTRADCARMAGLSPETIKNIEHGIFAPTPETIERILNAFSNKNVEFFVQHGSSIHYGVTMKANPDNDEAEEEQKIERDDQIAQLN